MKTRRMLIQILALALCLALLCPLCAFADDAKTYVPEDPDSYAVIDPAAMQKLVEDYVNGHKLNKEKISVGYCYLDTGDTWYYNGDHWYFGAGVYYVPVTMILAEWESSGKVTRDSNIQGISLGDAERYILVNSSNYYVHQVMKAIGSDKEVREKYMAYSPLPEEYYDPDFLDYGYFSARFLTDVMKTLYNESERFPNIIDCLKKSDNGSYFHGAMRGNYEVAQKSGNYIDRRNVDYNNTTGIIYTPHPFILTVMTENMGITQEVMWDMAVIFKDYTLSLDEAYETWKNGPAETPAPIVNVPATTEPGGEGGQQPSIQQPAQPVPEGQPGAAEQPGSDAAVEVQPQEDRPAAHDEDNPSNTRRMAVLIICAALLVILILGVILRPILRKKKETDEEADEDEEKYQY